MKTLVKISFLSFILLLGTGCSSESGPLDEGVRLQQDDIKQRIAQYYSSPSSSTQPVSSIKIEFDKKFPNATDVEWKVSNGIYKIDFEINDVDYEAWYDGNANLLMYKHDIMNNQLNQAVASAIATDYPGYLLDEVEKVYKGNIVGFYLDLKKNKEKIHAFYNENGTFISKTLWENDSIKPGNEAGSSTPAVDGNASDDDIDALISAYYSGRETDISTANVPVAIQASFNGLFANARDIDWETSADIYKVDFEINNVDYDAWYKQDGTLLAYKFDIARSSIPQVVKNAIALQFSGYTTEDAEKVIKPNSVGYWVELENRKIEENAYFAEDGTYISNSFYSRKSDAEKNPEQPIIPEIPADGNYTDNEIDALLLAYHQGRDTDIRQENVPPTIVTAFKTQFSSARDIEWDHVGDVYNVDFEIGGVDYEAWYVNGGTILMYMNEIRYNLVPAVVQNAVSSKYSEYMIDGVDFFWKGTVNGYIIELENKRTDAELIAIYKEDGTFIQQQHD